MELIKRFICKLNGHIAIIEGKDSNRRIYCKRCKQEGYIEYKRIKYGEILEYEFD